MMEAWIGLGGVIVGSTITITKDVWLSWIERRRDGSYSAIRLICILEEYANKCIDVVGDDGTAYGRPAHRTDNGEEYREAQIRTPDPLEYPKDIAWRSISESQMHRSLALSNKARSTDQFISASAENASPPDYEEFFDPRQEGYAQLGLVALELSDDLRKKFRISAESRTTLYGDWDPKEFLQCWLLRCEKRRTEARQRAEASPLFQTEKPDQDQGP
jgi:hypothetical protein